MHYRFSIDRTCMQSSNYMKSKNIAKKGLLSLNINTYSNAIIYLRELDKLFLKQNMKIMYIGYAFLKLGNIHSHHIRLLLES